MEIYKQHIPVKSWAEGDRPKEKLLKQGRRSLSDTELLAILINSGSALETSVELSRRILGSQQNDLNRLAQLTIGELMKFKGIGEAKAIAIIAAIELGRRMRTEDLKQENRITDSKDSFELMSRHFSDLIHEEFWTLLLGRSGKILSYHQVSTGGFSETIADPKMIFRLALEHKAMSIVLMHNHPSGNPRPSKADISLTKRLCDAGNLLDISVVDHIIFVNKGYFSFADEGIM